MYTFRFYNTVDPLVRHSWSTMLDPRDKYQRVSKEDFAVTAATGRSRYFERISQSKSQGFKGLLRLLRIGIEITSFSR